MSEVVTLGDGSLTSAKVAAIARGAHAELTSNAAVHQRIASSRQLIVDALTQGRSVYGITTGFGAAVSNRVDPSVAEFLPTNLMRYHGCGVGPYYSPDVARAVLAVRLNSLARGYSGVRIELLRLMEACLAHNIAPAIPELGSVGASGDLTPLSYIAALMAGEREAFLDGVLISAGDALRQKRLEPLQLAPKESLAIMNGTSVMAALACIAMDRTESLARASSVLSAMASDVMMGHRAHFDPQIFELKPHRGQSEVAAAIYAHLEGKPAIPDGPERAIQDRYSLRCAPHVIGVLYDALPFLRSLVETEINAVNDNPIIVGASPEHPEGRVLHGGNFYGGHVCLATDTLKNVVANVGDLLERQVVAMNQPSMSRGLPANLVIRDGDDRHTHHGFKAMEITASALTAEALKLTMPASVFSRSTEAHNQDKVSMGSISAREAMRILDLVETVAAIHLLMVCQAVDARGPHLCSPATRLIWKKVRQVVPPNLADRRMDGEITTAREQLLALLN